jgi:hypothetical protein
MNEALVSREEGTMIVNKKGEPLDVKQLIIEVKKAAGAIIVGDIDTNVRTDSRYWSVESADGRVVEKGVAILGKKGIPLESGEYVSLKEIDLALQNYVFKGHMKQQ